VQTHRVNSKKSLEKRIIQDTMAYTVLMCGGKLKRFISFAFALYFVLGFSLKASALSRASGYENVRDPAEILRSLDDWLGRPDFSVAFPVGTSVEGERRVCKYECTPESCSEVCEVTRVGLTVKGCSSEQCSIRMVLGPQAVDSVFTRAMHESYRGNSIRYLIEQWFKTDLSATLPGIRGRLGEKDFVSLEEWHTTRVVISGRPLEARSIAVVLNLWSDEVQQHYSLPIYLVVTRAAPFIGQLVEMKLFSPESRPSYQVFKVGPEPTNRFDTTSY
jgi:hypothetical protein